MDEKLRKTLAAPDFDAWRTTLWKEISQQAIGEGWVPPREITREGVVDHQCERWSTLWATLVEIRYLFRLPVARCVHARFLHSPKGARKVGVGYLSFHTSPNPSAEDKALFESRRAELLEWRANGGTPPRSCSPRHARRTPKCH